MAMALQDQPLVAAGHVPKLNRPRPAGSESAPIRRERQAGRRLAEERKGADFFRGGDVPDAGRRIVAARRRERAATGGKREGSDGFVVGLPDAHGGFPSPPGPLSHEGRGGERNDIAFLPLSLHGRGGRGVRESQN